MEGTIRICVSMMKISGGWVVITDATQPNPRCAIQISKRIRPLTNYKYVEIMVSTTW